MTLPTLPPSDGEHLGRAARALSSHLDERWVEVAPRVLAHALRATRRSFPVRTLTPGAPTRVSEQVVVAYLREALDGAVPGSAVAHISVRTGDDDRYEGVLIQLVVQYGVPVIPVADRIREIAAAVLTDLVGSEPDVHVQAGHVHVAHVTRADPQLTDPATD